MFFQAVHQERSGPLRGQQLLLLLHNNNNKERCDWPQSACLRSLESFWNPDSSSSISFFKLQVLLLSSARSEEPNRKWETGNRKLQEVAAEPTTSLFIYLCSHQTGVSVVHQGDIYNLPRCLSLVITTSAPAGWRASCGHGAVSSTRRSCGFLFFIYSCFIFAAAACKCVMTASAARLRRGVSAGCHRQPPCCLSSHYARPSLSLSLSVLPFHPSLPPPSLSPASRSFLL